MAEYWAKNNRSNFTQKVTEEQKKAIEDDRYLDFSFEEINEPTKPKVNNPRKKKNKEG